jgi:hypothetical protein
MSTASHTFLSERRSAMCQLGMTTYSMFGAVVKKSEPSSLDSSYSAVCEVVKTIATRCGKREILPKASEQPQNDGIHRDSSSQDVETLFFLRE